MSAFKQIINKAKFSSVQATLLHKICSIAPAFVGVSELVVDGIFTHTITVGICPTDAAVFDSFVDAHFYAKGMYKQTGLHSWFLIKEILADYIYE